MAEALRGADVSRDHARAQPEHSPLATYKTAAAAHRAATVDRAFSRGQLTGSSLLWHARLALDANGQPVDTWQKSARPQNLTQRAVDDFFVDDTFRYRATYDALGTVAQKVSALLKISEKISTHPSFLRSFAVMVSDLLQEIDFLTIPQKDLDSFFQDISKNIRWAFDTIERYDGKQFYVAKNADEKEVAAAVVGRFGVPLAYVSDGNGYRVMYHSDSEIVGDDEPKEFTFKTLRANGLIEVRGLGHGRPDRIFTSNGKTFSVLKDGRAIELPLDASTLTAVSVASGRKCYMHQFAEGVYYPIAYDEAGQPCELADRETHIIQNNIVWQKQKDESFQIAQSGFLVTGRGLIQYRDGRVTQNITTPNARIRIQGGDNSSSVDFFTDVYFDSERNKVIAYKEPTTGSWKGMRFPKFTYVHLGYLQFTDGRPNRDDGCYSHNPSTNQWTFVEYKQE